MWIDTRDCVPLTDGNFMAQTVYGRVTTMTYTPDGGWNTYYDEDGTIHKEYTAEEKADWDKYVVRWFKVPDAPKVPKAWKDEYARMQK